MSNDTFISKVTINMARNRKLDIVICDGFVEVFENDDDMEWIVRYMITETGLYRESLIPRIDDVPIWVKSDEQFRDFIRTLPAELAATKLGTK